MKVSYYPGCSLDGTAREPFELEVGRDVVDGGFDRLLGGISRTAIRRRAATPASASASRTSRSGSSNRSSR